MKTPTELKIARERGLTYYFTGKPCPKGHIADRYTKSSKCVDCNKERSAKYGKIYFQKNKERLRNVRKKHAEKNRDKYVEYQRTYREKNPEKYRKTIESGKEKNKKYQANWYQDNKERLLQKKYKKLKEDVVFRVKELVRSRIQSGLRMHTNKSKKSMRSIMYLGCTYENYIKYLEKKFQKGMTWENMGGKNGWQIDHIKPLAKFDLSKKNEQLMAFNFKNTQPMWAKENRVKGKR